MLSDFCELFLAVGQLNDWLLKSFLLTLSWEQWGILYSFLNFNFAYPVFLFSKYIIFYPISGFNYVKNQFYEVQEIFILPPDPSQKIFKQGGALLEAQVVKQAKTLKTTVFRFHWMMSNKALWMENRLSRGPLCFRRHHPAAHSFLLPG